MENLTPLTRLEQFLAKIAGDDIELPEVKTRLEYWLKEISENGGGGGGGGSSGLIVETVEESPDVVRLNKTMKEIMTAVKNAQPVYLKITDGDRVNFDIIDGYTDSSEEEARYTVSFGGTLFICDNENDYPTYNGGK
jgi:hypothetical protein